MDRKYTIIFILIWLIVSIFIALFLFLPFIFFAIAVLLILLAYDFYQKGRPQADKNLSRKAQPAPPIPAAPVPDTRTVQTKENKVPTIPEGVNQAAVDLKNKGNTFFRQNKFEDAIRSYASAVAIYPGYIDAWNNLGLAFLKTGKTDLARSCNEKVKELQSIRPPQPAHEPVVSTPVVTGTPVPVQPAISPKEKTGLQREEGEGPESDTISFLRDVARPAGYAKEDPEYQASPEPVPRVTRDLTEIPTIPADKEPDWKNLFKSVSEMEAPGNNIPVTTTKGLPSKSEPADTPAFDRVMPPLEKEDEKEVYSAGDRIYEPEPVYPATKEEIEFPAPEIEEPISGPAAEEIGITTEGLELLLSKHEELIPAPAHEEIGITTKEPELLLPEHEEFIPAPAHEKIGITTEEPELLLSEHEELIPAPVPEKIGITTEEIPVHITVQASSESISPDEENTEPFPFEIDAEIPGYTLLPPEIEEFPQYITDTPTSGHENIHAKSGEEETRPVEEEKIRDIKESKPAPVADEIKTTAEIQVPPEGPIGLEQEEKPPVTENLMQQEWVPAPDTPVPPRKGESPSGIGTETVIRKPKAERFPQEIPGGFEPYEQMVAHESLLTSEKTARQEAQTPAHVPDKLILIVDDNDYIVTGLEHMLRKNGYLTASCNSGQEALDILGKKNINAVLLDLNMEPMSGWQLLGIMRSDVLTKDIPVIIFSAKETLQEEASRTPLKISAFLSKPVNTRLLLSELKNIFEGEGSTG